jgi:hypothetical protein
MPGLVLGTHILARVAAKCVTTSPAMTNILKLLVRA